MTHAFLAAATGVLLVQFLPQARDESRFHGYYLIALGALLVFLSGMAFAARGFRFGLWVQVLPAIAGAALVVFATPRILLPPAAELVVFVLGGLALFAAAAFLARRQWAESRLAAVLIGAGGILGALELLRAGLARYAQYFQTLSTGMAGIIAWSVELAVTFGLAGLLAFLGGAVARSRHGVSRGRLAAQR